MPFFFIFHARITALHTTKSNPQSPFHCCLFCFCLNNFTQSLASFTNYRGVVLLAVDSSFLKNWGDELLFQTRCCSVFSLLNLISVLFRSIFHHFCLCFCLYFLCSSSYSMVSSSVIILFFLKFSNIFLKLLKLRENI